MTSVTVAFYRVVEMVTVSLRWRTCGVYLSAILKTRSLIVLVVHSNLSDYLVLKLRVTKGNRVKGKVNATVERLMVQAFKRLPWR